LVISVKKRRQVARVRQSRCLGLMVLAFLLLTAGTMPAQENATIRYDAASKVFRIDAANITYAFGINNKQQLQTIYWGKRLGAADAFKPVLAMSSLGFDFSNSLTPNEYVGWGGGLYAEPDLKITFSDGNRDLVLEYVSHKIEGDVLRILTKDILREVYVTVEYKADAETGILRRSATVDNRTREPITIEQVAAGTWNLPRAPEYRLRYLTGRWAGEWTVEEQLLKPGKIVLESRRGTTGAQSNPWFAIDEGSNDPEHGRTWFGALGWSGSWQISIEQQIAGNVRVTGGPNAFDFAYLLMPGATFGTPYFYGGFTYGGIGEASRLLHLFESDSILPEHPAPRPRPVLYNSWEATGFKVDEAGQIALAEKAASIGVERFVMDDGWFGQRKDDHTGLGDWYVNPEKFPHGLTPLIDKVHGLGMDFGLWVEPEMVNPDSDLYRKHPDWILYFPDRPKTEGRHQYVLNLARPDVREYVFGVLDKLLRENGIAFLKWDYNRNWSEPGWPSAPLNQQKNVYVDFIRNFYSILAELRQKHPEVEIESCSGGGSRVDLGVLQYADEVWPSDNTDPYDRLTIQNGFTYAYTPGVMMDWVTDSPTWMNNRSVSLEYRFLVAMQGSLGLGANLNKWQPADFDKARQMIAKYKEIRGTVQRGALYRLITPEHGGEESVTETVSRDGNQVVVFAFLHSSTEHFPFPTILLKGLDEKAIYRISSFAGTLDKATPVEASGAYWMQYGIELNLRGDFQAAAFTLARVR